MKQIFEFQGTLFSQWKSKCFLAPDFIGSIAANFGIRYFTHASVCEPTHTSRPLLADDGIATASTAAPSTV